jgi:hypothetical protein
MLRRILAAGLLSVIVLQSSATDARAGTWRLSDYGSAFATTQYVIEVEWWGFDRDHYYWQQVQSLDSYEDALYSLMFHEWALENGRLGGLYDHHPYYFPVDVRMRQVSFWNQYEIVGW